MVPRLTLPRLLVFFERAALLLVVTALLAASCNRTTDTPSPEPQLTSGAVKLAVKEAGLYSVTSSDLRADAPSLAAADPARLVLSLRGQPQPLWAEGEPGDFTLRFYGQSPDSRYTAQSNYWLEIKPTGEITPTTAWEQPAGASVSTPVDACLAMERLEQNLVYAPQAESGDHWFWQSLAAPKNQPFEVTLAHAAAGAGRVRVAVWASTSAPVNPDHHLQVLINGQVVADESWDGNGRRTIEADVPAGVLVDGANAVELALPGDTTAPADIVFVDWIEIEYPRTAEAVNDRLDCAAGESPLKLTGFDDEIFLLDITDPYVPVRLTGLQPGDGDVIFQGEPDHRYLAAGSKGMLKPVEIAAPRLSPDLRAASSAADYLAIGPDDLLAPLDPLLALRTSQGLRVMSIPLQAIYDQFNDGFPEPEAIQKFLAFTHQSWQTAPRYVMLVGDATYDPRGYLAPPDANRLPTFFIQTVFGGETASDVLFAQLDEDGLPDVAIGRVPARSAAQVRSLATKLLAYEQAAQNTEQAAQNTEQAALDSEQAAGGESWTRRVLAVSDGNDTSFAADAQTFLDQLPDGFESTLYSPAAGAVDANAEITKHLDEGVFFMAYFGHGSMVMWGKDRLFSTEDAAKLSNTHLPLVMNMSCLTGLFTHPKQESLAEVLLFQPDGGAAAVLAPTSLTLPTDQAMLSGPLAQALGQDSAATVGEWLLQAQRQTPQNQDGVREVLLTFLLFGDPALRLAQSTP